MITHKKLLDMVFLRLKQLPALIAKKKKPLITAAVILTVLGLPPLVFFLRQPALIVTDELFETLYGEKRAKRQQLLASLSLFRLVQPIVIADGASPDIAAAAVAEAASQPFCVVFPRRYAAAAVFYNGEFPQIPCVILGGLIPRYDLPLSNGVLCVYGTDRDTDLYRAGVFAGILANARQTPAAQDASVSGDSPPSAERSPPSATGTGEESPGQPVVFWQDNSISESQRMLFLMGVNENSPETEVIFTNSLNEIPEPEKLSCAVIAGTGTEIIDKIPQVPVILFSWLDPALTSSEVVIMFDDSPWSQAVAAVRLAAKREEEGSIPSKTLIFSKKLADNGISKVLKRSSGKTIQYPAAE